jgi:hypothetical protein
MYLLAHPFPDSPLSLSLSLLIQCFLNRLPGEMHIFDDTNASICSASCSGWWVAAVLLALLVLPLVFCCPLILTARVEAIVTFEAMDESDQLPFNDILVCHQHWPGHASKAAYNVGSAVLQFAMPTIVLVSDIIITKFGHFQSCCHTYTSIMSAYTTTRRRWRQRPIICSSHFWANPGQIWRRERKSMSMSNRRVSFTVPNFEGLDVNCT